MKSRRLALLAAAAVPLVSSVAWAVDLSVDQASGNSPYAFTGTTTYGTVRVGVSTTGTLTQNSGVLTATTALIVAANSGSVGTYTLGSTGTLTANGPTTVGLAGAGTFNQNAGTATLAGGLTLSGATGGRGTYNLNGGTLATSGVTGNNNGGTNATFYFNGGTLRPTTSSITFFQALTAAYVRNGGAAIDTNGQNVTVNQALSHSNVTGDAAKDGGLTKTGVGTLTLAGANTYTGDTNVYNGTLLIVGSVGIPYRSGFTPESYFRVNGTTTPVVTLSGAGAIQSYTSTVGNNDKAVFNQSGGSHTVATDLDIGRSDLFDNSASNGAYNLSGGTLNAGTINVGNGGTGSVAQTGGTDTAGLLRVGYAPNAQNIGNGTYTLGGTGQLNATVTSIGVGAPGSFTQTAGTHTNVNLSIGVGGGTGSYSLSSGQLTTQVSAYVGNNGTGTFTHSAGTFKVGQLTVGSGGGNSSYALSNTGQLQVVGYPATPSSDAIPADVIVSLGKFTQTGGTSSIAGRLDLGSGVPANAVSDYGTYALSAGTVTTAQTIVGDNGRGTFSHTGGTHNTDGLTVALAGSTGAYTLVGTGALAVNGNAFIGSGGTGTFNQAAGTHNVNGTLYLGYSSTQFNATTGNGTYTLSGGALTTNATQVANTGTGTFNQSGGTHTTSQMLIGLNKGTGVYNLSGPGVLNNTVALGVGYTGPGTFNQTNGTVTTGGNLYLSVATGGSGTYNLNGGSLQTIAVIGNSSGGTNATFNFNGGTLRAGAANTNFLDSLSRANVRNNGLIFDTNSFAVTLANALSHSAINGDAAVDGGLAKTGTGTLTLTAANTYTGNTIVSAGTLAITAGSVGVPNSTATFTVDGTAAANATASLGGTATLTANASYVGRTVKGTFNQTGGTHAAANLYVGATNATGNYNLSAGQLSLGTNALVGYGGAGFLTQSGGVANVTGTLFLGYAGTTAATGNGTYNLSNGTLATAETQVGNTGTGTFNQTGGTLTTPRFFVGLTNGTGTYNLSGTGALNTSAFAVVGLGGPGTFNQTGGVATFAGGLFVAGGTNGTGTYNLNGGTLAARYVTGTKNGGTNATFNFNGGTLRPTTVSDPDYLEGMTAANVRNGGVRFDTNGIDTGINQVLSHSSISGDAAVDGGLTKLGLGTLTLTAANTYTGATTVSAGTLALKPAAYATVLTNSGGATVAGGRLVLDYTGGTSPVAQVKSILDGGYAGNFATGQIRSTTLTTGQTIGYGDNGSLVTIRVTLPGDANLDGQVDFNDFLVLQNNFGKTTTRFDQGNFNYDGATDFNDFLVLQNNFGKSIGSGGPAAVTAAEYARVMSITSASAVPEPTSLAVLSLGGATLLRRRRR